MVMFLYFSNYSSFCDKGALGRSIPRVFVFTISHSENMRAGKFFFSSRHFVFYLYEHLFTLAAAFIHVFEWAFDKNKYTILYNSVVKMCDPKIVGHI